MVQPWKPTRKQLLRAAGKRVPDLIAPDLRVLFVGINPGLYSAAVKHHFARPGNRFWPALQAGGFTPRILSPFEETELLALGYGIVNIVQRGTARADELSGDELEAGGKRLLRLVPRYRPEIFAVLGVGAFRDAFDQPDAVVGKQAQPLGGATAWVLPNPSGLNAHYQAPALAALFRELYDYSQRLLKR